MSSLQDLLAEDGFHRRSSSRPTKPKNRLTPDNSVSLPIYICRDRKTIHRPEKSVTQNGSSVFPSKRAAPKAASSNSKSRASEDSRQDEPAIDEVAVRAIISILGGYVGRFMKDESFRNRVHSTCMACIAQRKDPDDPMLTNMELGIESIERLAENGRVVTKELRVRSLQNSIRLLNIIASLNSPNSRNGNTCGVPNAHLSACAQLYLAIIYKIEKNDRISGRHLLQVFCDSPSLARTHLIPDLWEHFFLPHLLHLKVWYNKEVEFISNSNSGDKDRVMKLLSKAYNDRMDMGTAQFALYYKEWLKVGVKAPSVPSVDLPSRSCYDFSRKQSVSMGSRPPSINKSLYKTVFGPSFERAMEECKGKNCDFFNEDGEVGPFSVGRDVFAEEGLRVESEKRKLSDSVHSNIRCNQRLSFQLHQNPRSESDYFRFFMCRSEPVTGAAHQSSTRKNGSITKEPNTHVSLSNISNAITTISSSDSLTDCEIAIRMVAKTWLDSHGDPIVETALSKESVIEGLLEIMFSSDNDEILELAISLLAELVVRNEANRQIVLNADPQLEIFMKLLRSSILFLKAAVLLYLLKPKAKQMLSPDWVPLVLRVFEFSDRLQTLFTVQCSPQAAVFYLMGQLLTGFDVDRNVENAKQVVSLGGLKLLIRRLELGDSFERKVTVSLLMACIQADGSCRHYLASNIKKSSILELLLGSQRKSSAYTLSLLIELICLNRRTQINKFLNELKNEGCLNAMHILLVYLQRAPPEQRPLIAVVLLQLDLLGDPSQSSVYREEAVDAIVTALDCGPHDEMIQEQSSRALLLLGSRFSYTGEPSTEQWLLKQAGLDDVPSDSFSSKEIVIKEITQLEEEENATEDWLRKVATILLTSGNKRFVTVLSKSIANGIPRLARACLVIAAWMSGSISSIQNANIRSMTAAILVPRLMESLNYDRALEERVLASLSLLNFVRNSDCFSMIAPLDEEFVGPLQNLAQVTWTAKELLSMARIDSTFEIKL
ncbi:putative E3 ubiquitin-protein ligase LIN [Magnolia sinica]|uniref:putative E3 ubiquitin-protein ligase LIN n=1 Tax=Magnolia sinica TaxID=86752 RepID=UPI002658B9C5|nr:putative E3 ubiquitin-protein ligase LIN [Magnolia sinica]